MAKAHSLKYVYEFSCKQCNIKYVHHHGWIQINQTE